MGNRTPLYDNHIKMGAKVVDFGGWDMPLHYGSQIEEHHRVRSDAGVCDVSHMLALDIGGGDARAFLRYALANDVARLERPGSALYSCLLNERGGILDDLIVYFVGENQYRVVVNAGTAGKDLAWIEALRQRRSDAPDITARHGLCMLAAQGPQARARVWDALPETREATEPLLRFHAARCGDFFIARTGYTGEDGFELMFPAERAERVWGALMRAGALPCGLGARDTLRLEAGMNLYGQDMDESTTPAESGLAWTVNLSVEREFVGRVAIEHERPTRKLVGLMLLGRGVLRAHQRAVTAHGEGLVTSGGFAPTLGRSIALARVPAAVGTIVRVQVRERLLDARVVKPPFVRNGRNLIGPIEEQE